ncbi:MAG: hypothetical protein K2N94_05030 [Lachnospiraceae bacterium]|nr:hypothetical protein [Lachnospiraceae bacterium]
MKRISCFFIFCTILLLSACGKEKIKPGIPLQDVTAEYEIEGALKSVAALEDGTMFALTGSPAGYRISRFDVQGECTGTYSLESYTNIDSIVVTEDGETIYFVGQNKLSMILMAFHTATGQFEELCDFWFDIVQARKIVLLGDNMYVMGQKKLISHSMYSSTNREYDFSAGDTILCCSMKDGEYSALGIEYPINIASSGKGTLIVFAYFPEEGYCLVEYDPGDASIKQKARLDECRFYDFAVCNDGNSLLYDGMLSSRGLLLADFEDPDLEIEIYDNSTAWNSDFRVWYGAGKVYLQDAGSQKLVSFPLSAVQKKNKAVRLVATGELSAIAPYGCGYRLERIEEEWDKIALKMMAQDTDYDLCLSSSGYGKSIAMRDSDVFYPLNDLPGIGEYLERCFPYVREAATTEDGTIWMLPFSANVYAMLVQEERAAERGLNLHNNMTLSEFAQLVRGLSEEDQGLFMVYPEEVSDDFLKRYFWHNSSVQGGTFLENLESLRVLYRNEALLNPPGNVNQEILLCTVEAFGRYPRYSTREGFSIFSVPKGEPSDKNNVTLYYLVVNGKSKYREEALNYLADLIAYLMRRDDLMIFKDYRAEAGSPEEQIYELFANGEVSFAVDEDVYQKDCADVLKGGQSLEEYVQEVERRLRLYLEE